MHSKGFGIASLVFVVLAFAAHATWVLQNLSPVFFGLSLAVASLAALKGDRRYTIVTLAAWLFLLLVFPTRSIAGAWQFTVTVGFLAPVAGLFFATARSRSNSKAYVLPTFVLFFVLAGFQISSLVRVGSDWGWQRGGLEPKSVQLPDDVCFSTPDVFCVLGLAEKAGLPAQARVRILIRLAALQLEAGNAVVAIEWLTEAISTYETPFGIDTGLLRQIAMLQWKAGDSTAAKEMLNTVGKVAELSTGVGEMVCVELSQIKIGDSLGAQATRRTALRKVGNPNHSARSIVAGLLRIAAASAEVGDEAGGREVLAEALSVALEMEDSEKRGLAIRDVAKGYLRMGDLEEALSLAQEIEREPTRWEVIRAVSHARKYPGAAQNINDLGCEKRFGSPLSLGKRRLKWRKQLKCMGGTQYGRACSLVIDAVGQIDAGKVSAAAGTLNRALLHARRLSNGPLLNPDHLRDRTLALIAPLQAAVGLEDAALETVRNIDHVVSRNIALRDIAIIRAHAGNMQEALLNVWWIADQPLDRHPSARARALGDIALAIGSHLAIPNHRTLNWCALTAVWGVNSGRSCARDDSWSAFF